MSTDIFTLRATARERTGSRFSRRVRESGGLPAVVYGHKIAPESVTLEAREAVKQFQLGHKLFKLDLAGSENNVILKDIQFDHLGDEIIHVDLERVDLNERVNVSVPIRLKGEAVGLKTAGAYLIQPTGELDIECTVGNLEESITVDISELEAGSSIHASDLDLPHQYVLKTDPEALIAGIQIKAETEEETAEGADAEAPAAPEVITERKPEDGE